MQFTDITAKTIDDALSSLDSGHRGITAADAATRLQEYGPNTIDDRRTTWLAVLRRQLVSPFIALLVAAATLSFLLGETFDGTLIVIFIAVNTGLGFYQEFKSEQTLHLLKKYFMVRATVLRDGKEILTEASGIVPGDVIVLRTGDVVPADARIIEEHGLSLDESPLTGESAPVRKTSRTLAKRALEQYEAENIVFSGTTVVGGTAQAAVFATGSAAAVGAVAKLVSETVRVSPFEQGISRFSRVILRLVLVTLTVVLLANVFIEGRKADIVELVIFSIALAVSIVPEALPVVMTFSLSRGAVRLAKHKVVVKRLSAIEDLGGMDILCTDKTGTITENVLTVADVLGPDHGLALRYAALGAGQRLGGIKLPNNAFDLAVWRYLDAQGREQVSAAARLSERPFDPQRRRSSAIVQLGRKRILITRGAPEALLGNCVGMDASKRKSALSWIAEQGKEGRRVLAVAWKPVRGSDIADEDDCAGLRFAGIISFVDPLKKDAAAALRRAEALGVQVKIITGDAREVAGAVARKIGLIDDPARVLTGEEFEALDDAAKHAAVKDHAVFARISPSQKFAIVSLLREGARVGFLGEGINDAPALKIADVALVVDDASDIARDAADIVLLKKGLGVIVDGIREGREVFANTMKYIRATLASNFGNFYAVAIVSLFVPYLPLLPLQILLINLLTDFPMIAVATDSVDPRELRRPQAYDVRSIVLIATVLGIVSTVFDFLFFAIFSRMRPGALQVNWFLGSVLTELLFLFSIRTRLPFFRGSRPSAGLLALSVAAAALAFAATLTPIGRSLFNFTAPRPNELLLTFAIVGAFFFVSERVKLLYFRGASPRSKHYVHP